MNPFDLPPTGAPVSADPPGPALDSTPDRPRRGLTALVAVLTFGLVGGGVAGVSQFASADRPELAASAHDEPSDDTIVPVDDEPTEASDEASSDGSGDDGTEQDDRTPTDDGQIVLDFGDDDRVVLDLGDLDISLMGDLTECIGLPALGGDGRFGEFSPDDWSSDELPFDLEDLLGDLPFDLEALEDLEGDWSPESGEFGGLGGIGVDANVTVVGPDGVSVVDLGENGSVTVTADDGEITVATEGDATVSDLDDLFGELGSYFEPGLFDDEQIGELPRFDAIDAEAIESCIADILGN